MVAVVFGNQRKRFLLAAAAVVGIELLSAPSAVGQEFRTPFNLPPLDPTGSCWAIGACVTLKFAIMVRAGFSVVKQTLILVEKPLAALVCARGILALFLVSACRITASNPPCSA